MDVAALLLVPILRCGVFIRAHVANDWCGAEFKVLLCGVVRFILWLIALISAMSGVVSPKAPCSDDIEARLKELEERVAGLEEYVDFLLSRVDSLERAVKRLRSSLHDLESSLYDLEKRVKGLNSDLDRARRAVDRLSGSRGFW